MNFKSLTVAPKCQHKTCNKRLSRILVQNCIALRTCSINSFFDSISKKLILSIISRINSCNNFLNKFCILALNDKANQRSVIRKVYVSKIAFLIYFTIKSKIFTLILNFIINIYCIKRIYIIFNLCCFIINLILILTYII